MAPSKPAHAIVRYRKHTPSPEKGRFCTGYSTMYQAKWDENKEKCIIYQLPPEILLSIMECLDVPSMYMARQACSLMWSFFNDLSFKWFHYMLKDKKGNIIPGAPPGFKHDALAEHMSDIIKRLLPDGRCRDCQYVYDFGCESRIGGPPTFARSALPSTNDCSHLSMKMGASGRKGLDVVRIATYRSLRPFVCWACPAIMMRVRSSSDAMSAVTPSGWRKEKSRQRYPATRSKRKTNGPLRSRL